MLRALSSPCHPLPFFPTGVASIADRVPPPSRPPCSPPPKGRSLATLLNYRCRPIPKQLSLRLEDRLWRPRLYRHRAILPENPTQRKEISPYPSLRPMRQALLQQTLQILQCLCPPKVTLDSIRSSTSAKIRLSPPNPTTHNHPLPHHVQIMATAILLNRAPRSDCPWAKIC